SHRDARGLSLWWGRQQSRGHLHGTSVTAVIHLNGYRGRTPRFITLGHDLHIVSPWAVVSAYEYGAIRIWIDLGHGLSNSKPPAD
ncbi:MAG: hypothetical protein OXI83_13760, partial [Gemmatimonadota bacterium]|nr:hypothetical protein [Gemmatimonadota bacterium]